MKNIALVLLLAFSLTACAGGGFSSGYNSKPISAGTVAAVAIPIGIALGASSYFGNQTNQALIGAWEKTENERILAYKQLNARCAVGGDGVVSVFGGSENSGRLTVSGTNSGTSNCPTSVLPYPQPSGNTSFHQVSAPGTSQPQQLPGQLRQQRQRPSCDGLEWDAFQTCMKVNGWR